MPFLPQRFLPATAALGTVLGLLACPAQSLAASALTSPGTLQSVFEATPASGVLVAEPARTWSVGSLIDDLHEVPSGFEIHVVDSAIRSLTRVEVRLELGGVTPGGGYAGEMFVSLTRDYSHTAVLLNRVGVTPEDDLGQAYNGWNVTFADDAVDGDIHEADLAGGLLGGIWAPDGRSVATDVARPFGLGVFDGLAGNGVWRLNVADLELGGQMWLESWSILLTGEVGPDSPPSDPGPGPEQPGVVPEPGSGWFAAAMVAMGSGIWGRRLRRSLDGRAARRGGGGPGVGHGPVCA